IYDSPACELSASARFESPINTFDRSPSMKRLAGPCVTLVLLICAAVVSARPPGGGSGALSTPPGRGRYQRPGVRNATIVDGNGTPAAGPKDIVVEGNRIAEVVALDPVAVREGRAKRPAAGDAEIDATGKYVLPGLINLHGHTQDERGGVPMSFDYCLKLWLSCGITTVRDVGSDYKKTLPLRDKSSRGEVVAPRLFIYPMFGYSPAPRNEQEARARVREVKAMGADGLKSLGVDRDILMAMLDEAHKVGLRVAHHTGVEETNAWDDIKGGTTSIEHWYGIPDAAITSGRQNFPSTYNYNNETDRFPYPQR